MGAMTHKITRIASIPKTCSSDGSYGTTKTMAGDDKSVRWIGSNSGFDGLQHDVLGCNIGGHETNMGLAAGAEVTVSLGEEDVIDEVANGARASV